MTQPKIFIFPGNGDSHIDTDNWYAWVRDELRGRGFEVFAEDMPDATRDASTLPEIIQIIEDKIH